MANFEDYTFIFGKEYDDANVYTFMNKERKYLRISEKLGKFINGAVTKYLLFEYQQDGKDIKEYVDRDSQEYIHMHNIKPIIENYDNVVSTCQGCKTIVLTSMLTSARGDKCKYCDEYVCKGCKKLFPLIALDENRLCKKCRKEQCQ